MSRLARQLPCFLLMSMLALVAVPAIAAEAPTAVAVVEQFQATLIAVMKDAKTLGYPGRYQKLAPAIDASHDLAGIAKFAAGRYWDGLTAEQRQRLVAAFTLQSVATYAHRFDDYAGQSFKTVSEETLSGTDTMVHSEFNDPTGDTVRFDYVLHPTEHGWRIINIIVNGVSDLAIKRSEYSSILRSDGVDVLVGKLNDQASNYARISTH